MQQSQLFIEFIKLALHDVGNDNYYTFYLEKKIAHTLCHVKNTTKTKKKITAKRSDRIKKLTGNYIRLFPCVYGHV